ncbi:hypothetical protein [Agrobacterium cavarae]|uniref:hypothetical protein n=1 Tax=Agrobacterium cavarae TaxID=2528239 RepID=UPI003FD4F2B4
MKTYQVLRQHLGDKMYMPGDNREAVQSDVQHLINNGVLREAKAKSDTAASNKAEKAAPKNKSV